jgi:hypothetical protein
LTSKELPPVLPTPSALPLPTSIDMVPPLVTTKFFVVLTEPPAAIANQP